MRIKAAPGLILEELYEVIESFGGGMGAVHRVRHRSWNIEVAIKHPLESAMLNLEQLDMFYSECITWCQIGLHPYVATCFYAREINGLPSVVAEFVQKGSLHQSIHRRELYRGDEDKCLARMLTIAASTAFGLARAHEANLIHCDVKPENMLLTAFGTAKITDFGLAIAQIGPDGLTRQRWMTEAYAAPEQLMHESLTPAVDAWGWGASMLEMFLGNRSWQRGTACGAVLGKFLEDGRKEYRIPQMPESIAALLGECFRFDPGKRLSDFGLIAGRICHCYEELFDEPCPVSKPNLELISADSLNNRAVSRFDLGDILEVHRLLDEAFSVDPLHPESNFNSALLGYTSTREVSQPFLDRLEQVTQFDL